MNYNELKTFLDGKKITMKDFCEQLGITRQGIQKSLDTGNFPMGKVVEICKMFHFSPNYFFGWPEQPVQGGVYAANITGGNTQNSSEAIRVLADQLKEKDRQISKLLSMLGKDGKK